MGNICLVPGSAADLCAWERACFGPSAQRVMDHILRNTTARELAVCSLDVVHHTLHVGLDAGGTTLRWLGMAGLLVNSRGSTLRELRGAAQLAGRRGRDQRNGRGSSTVSSSVIVRMNATRADSSSAVRPRSPNRLAS